MRILILGVSGMLGSTMFQVMSQASQFEVYGTARSFKIKKYFHNEPAERIITDVDLGYPDTIVDLFAKVRPNAVINCIGLVKQLSHSNSTLFALPINSLLPHKLAKYCELIGSRLIHISTDCVFSGLKGNYKEDDEPDAQDLYGRSKLLGEVYYPHTVTLRTSIIGHELNSSHSLIGWFISQRSGIKGYRHAIFSGLPTCELSKIIRDIVLLKPELSGLYHVAAKPISKYDLLNLVNLEYNKGLEIYPDDNIKIDRSLDGSRFHKATGYIAPTWPHMIAQMRTTFREGNENVFK